MDAATARSIFLPMHGAVGLVTLGAGFTALAAKKQAGLHPRAGRIFAAAMGGAILAALPVLVATGNLFLSGMGAFAGYLTLVGWWVAKRRGAGSVMAARLCGAAILGFCAFAALGVWSVVMESKGLGTVAVAMGGFGALSAGRHRAWFLADPATREPWLAVHLRAAGGALIAGLTAFSAAVLTNWVPMIPEPVVWLAPVVILAPVLRRMAQSAHE